MLVFGVELSTFPTHTCYEGIFTSLSSIFFLFHSLTLPFSLILLLLSSPSFSLSSPWQITRYRQQTVTERKIFSGGENCPELVTENTSNSSRGGKRKMVDGRKRERETRNFLSLCNERRNLHTAKYIIKRSASSFSSSSPENVSDLRFLLVWSAEIPGYTIPDKVHFTIVVHKWVLQNTYIYIYIYQRVRYCI